MPSTSAFSIGTSGRNTDATTLPLFGFSTAGFLPQTTLIKTKHQFSVVKVLPSALVSTTVYHSTSRTRSCCSIESKDAIIEDTNYLQWQVAIGSLDWRVADCIDVHKNPDAELVKLPSEAAIRCAIVTVNVSNESDLLMVF